ncbi:predicted protein [Naegleria gruberi]|uniref:Predicted protein n=1 Tax=Naegleria gruberi TaxID=5762 RepID=D2VPR9_NAEGR|nr:uncharacterized protein NAEGRDRAFT_70961 [Naegleria gruberi]EFC41253.1 predicted protein [Naegleria gruberi]|eukprot:XP_002673997.1 predicted protein [Naegleria gruberi strain NEG-M]
MSLPISPHRMTSLDSTPSLSSMATTSRKELAASVLINTPQNVDEEVEVEDLTIAEKEQQLSNQTISEDQPVEQTAEKPISYNEEEEAVSISTIKPLSLIEENNSSSMVSFQDFLTLKKNQKQQLTGEGLPQSSPIVSPRTLAAVKKELDSSRVEILEPVEEFLDSSSPYKNATSFRSQSNDMLQEISEPSSLGESVDEMLMESAAEEDELITESESSELMYAVPYEASPDILPHSNNIKVKKNSEERKKFNNSFAETQPYEITIQYEKQSKEFKPGETVKGYVKLKNAIKMEMSQAIITLLGKESLFYPQLSVEENVITQIETRFGRSIFYRGAHMLEFSFTLPDNIEPSIVKNFATISYTINASVQCLLQNVDGDYEEQYLSCISSFTVHIKETASMQPINYSYGESSSCQCNIELTRNVFIPEDVIQFTLDIKDCALDVKSKEIIIKVVERTSYRSLLDDFKEQDNNVIVFHTLTDCHTEDEVSKTIQVILPSDISESTRGLTKMMTVSHLIEIEFFGEG